MRDDFKLILIQFTKQLKVLIMIRKATGLSFLKSNKWHAQIRSNFSVHKQSKKVAYTVGFKSRHIENIRSLSFKPKYPIEYINGKYLIYKSKASYFRVIKDYFWYMLGIVTLGFMLYHRFYFESNPINKHLYIGGIFVMFVGMARKFLRNHNIVKEMYLLEGGKATQVIFQNQLKRKMFGEITQNTYYNSLFFTPAQKEGQMMWRPINLFPQTVEALQKEVEIGRYWKKLYSNQENFLLIPKYTQFINAEILVQVMNGKIILS